MHKAISWCAVTVFGMTSLGVWAVPIKPVASLASSAAMASKPQTLPHSTSGSPHSMQSMPGMQH